MKSNEPNRPEPKTPLPGFNVDLWIAQGFGVGRIPFAPGTFGSLAGLVWFAVLLAPKNLAVFCVGIVVSIPLAVWLCGRAEKILKQSDPGSVVLDEIIAVPICFATWVGILYARESRMPEPEYFFSVETWLLTFVVFALFRLFDIAKPWPVGKSQSLPGGWGVVVDDVLAAVYVNAVFALVWVGKALAGGAST